MILLCFFNMRKGSYNLSIRSLLIHNHLLEATGKETHKKSMYAWWKWCRVMNVQCFHCTNNNDCGNAGLRNNSFSNLLENKDKEVKSEVEQTDVRVCKLYFLGQTLLVGYTLFPLLLTFCIVMCSTVFPPITLYYC